MRRIKTNGYCWLYFPVQSREWNEPSPEWFSKLNINVLMVLFTKRRKQRKTTSDSVNCGNNRTGTSTSRLTRKKKTKERRSGWTAVQEVKPKQPDFFCIAISYLRWRGRSQGGGVMRGRGRNNNLVRQCECVCLGGEEQERDSSGEPELAAASSWELLHLNRKGRGYDRKWHQLSPLFIFSQESFLLSWVKCRGEKTPRLSACSSTLWKTKKREKTETTKRKRRRRNDLMSKELKNHMKCVTLNGAEQNRNQASGMETNWNRKRELGSRRSALVSGDL